MKTKIQENVSDLELDEAFEEEPGRYELKLQFVEMRARGLSYASIAKKLKVSKGTLSSWNQELEAEIARLKAVELEALQEEYFLLKEGRIRLLGEQIKAIQDELKERKLSEVNTDKLMELLLKFYSELKPEYVAARPGDLEEDKTAPEMNAQDIAREIHRTLQRYRAGLIQEGQAKQELVLLQAMLKAYEQGELEEKVDRLQAIMEGRKG